MVVLLTTTDCTHHLFSCPRTSVATPPSPPPWKSTAISPPPYRNPNSSRRNQRCCSSKRPGPNWASNAEDSVRTGRFRFSEQALEEEETDGRFRPKKEKEKKKRSWWSDDPSEFDEEESEFELFDDEFSSPLDRIWFVKVFQSYGWMLPAIIISMLLATGPKAFLMALALPLGQTAISLAVDKLWGTTRDAPRRTSKARKKPFARAASPAGREDSMSYSNGKERSGFQSWVETVDEVVEKDANPRGLRFGGWDALDRRGESSNGSASQPSQTEGKSHRLQPEKKGKLTRGGRYTGVPLFIRLLIAVFPFLGSWTRIL
eukprot:TRINITY_DN11191_c0_g1_i1.p1 TRINITY_DN11191_c0_g1~~TRINITY_DN11191_c0_g1_i1.p1  ORF type:complete len:317 (-),score=54.08 TRINITY_DN11191_c0_g1_i1:2877-3827(-)